MSAYLLGVDASAASQRRTPPRAALEVVRDASALKPFDTGVVVGAAPSARSKLLKSELSGVGDDKWTEFAIAMRTAQPGAVSHSQALGMFEMKPRRLVDLGLARSVKGGPTGAFIAEFTLPMTKEKFLGDMKEQYRAFSRSMADYVDKLRKNEIARPDGGAPQGMSLSGVLAILHKCGPSGLKTWNDVDDRFPSTAALFERVNGIF